MVRERPRGDARDEGGEVMGELPKVDITGFVCGPSNSTCTCRCPESCDHVWDGPVLMRQNGGTSTCSRCGAPADIHDRWVLP